MWERVRFSFDWIGLFVVVLTLSLLMSACGGGGGGDGDEPGDDTPGNPPTRGDDPLYLEQWHLKNTGQAGGLLGEDIHVEPVWESLLGQGVRIAVVDLDLEIAHEDLAANVVPGASFNYLNRTSNPTGPVGIGLGHGTSVAGIVAAVGFNNIGVRGVAPEADLVGYNLTAALTSVNESDAMTRGLAQNAVSTNSWGFRDNTGTFDAAPTTWELAVDTGLSQGRSGLGLVYLWAGGNGGGTVDNSNYDGRANYPGVMAIAAVDDQGRQASYSESGANLLVSAPGGEFCDTHTITTVDRTRADGSNNAGLSPSGNPDYANDNYTRCFNGTSAATPVVAGVVALMLQSNPTLSWRDVRLILAQTARKNDLEDDDWTASGAGFLVNHKYGFGVVDAQTAVEAARGWAPVGPSVVAERAQAPNIPIPDAPLPVSPGVLPFGPPVSDTLLVSGTPLQSIEFVEVILTSDHTYAGDLEVTLTSPSGTVSRLSEAHPCIDPDFSQSIPCGSAFSGGWRFGTVRHLGESPLGNWRLTVRDGANRDIGAFQSWRLTIHGR